VVQARTQAQNRPADAFAQQIAAASSKFANGFVDFLHTSTVD